MGLSIDRKNTISNLETNIRWIEDMECHQFPGWGNVTMAMRDALELLKEQEPVKPTWSRDEPFCGACDSWIRGGKFCIECGKPILWEGK